MSDFHHPFDSCLPPSRHWPGLPETQWDRGNWLVIDIETTGLQIGYDRVIEVGFLHGREREIRPTRQEWYCNPGRPILNSDIHGITDETVKEWSPFKQSAWLLIEELDQVDRIFAYNVGYDKAMLEYEFKLCGVEMPDTPWREVQSLLGYLGYPTRMSNNKPRRHRLQTVANKLGFKAEKAHRAYDDALLTARIMLAACEASRQQVEGKT